MTRSAARVVFFLIVSLTAHMYNVASQDLIEEWDRVRDTVADTIGEMLDELAYAKVSGKELAVKADRFRERWRTYMAERKEMASALAVLAGEFEKSERFSEALALYEGLWWHFPEQQELIGKIKRHRALAEVPINLSTPQSAFLSLKRAVMTYKLTSATFGIAHASAILYEDEPIERHEWEAEIRKLKSLLPFFVAEEAPSECSADGSDAKRKHPWPELLSDPWRKIIRYSLSRCSVSRELKEVTALNGIEKISEASPVPIMVKPAAMCCLQKLSAEQEGTGRLLSASLKDVPLDEALRYVFEATSPGSETPFATPLLAEHPGWFACHIRHTTQDQLEPILTLVIQHEPVVPFPDDLKSEPEPASDSIGDFLAQTLCLEKLPPGWRAHFDAYSHMETFAAPLSALRTWGQMVRIPESGRYYGRVVPLFRCLRAYPIAGPRPDPYGDPKPRYILDVQLGWQRRRMGKFLDDRFAIVALLGSKLVGVKQRSPHRFIPRLDLPHGITGLTSRLGLWYDGKAYRFLIFDSQKDRERWLKGEDWLDMPSDVDDYDWKTEEEREEESREFDKQHPDDPILSLPEK